MGAFFLFCGVLANGLASISIKIGATPPYGLQFNGFFKDISKSWPLMLGVILYFMALSFYILALSRLPLSIVHPVMTAGSMVLVSIFSLWILEETVNFNLITGLTLIIIGVVFLARSYTSNIG